jgi:alpha-beta hydrolase superfamily lysophospholipase
VNEHPNEIVVFVHGISSYHFTFNRIANILLTKGYNVLQFDLIGRGYSEPSKNGKYGRDEHIQQMHSLLDHLQLLRPKHLYIIGHSMGGCLSTLFTSEYGEYVKSLTLIAPAGLLGYFPIEFTKQCCPCILGMMKSRFAKRKHAIKSWKGDFYSHEGESLTILNERIQELSKGLDNNPHAFEAYWNTLMQFPLTNITRDNLKVAYPS